MSKRLFALMFAACPLAVMAAPESYTLDPFHTFPNFTVDHLGVSTLYGRFNKSAGKLTIDRAAKTGSVELTVDTASVDTGDSDKGSRRALARRTPSFRRLLQRRGIPEDDLPSRRASFSPATIPRWSTAT